MDRSGKSSSGGVYAAGFWVEPKGSLRGYHEKRGFFVNKNASFDALFKPGERIYEFRHSDERQ